MAYSVSGELLFIEKQRGNEGINKIRYYLDLGGTTACTNINGSKKCDMSKGGKRGPFWQLVLLKEAVEAAMDAGTENIGMLQIIQKDYLRITLRK